MKFEENLSAILKDNFLHAKWLNTLSFMENAGAKKISASEDKQKVNLIILKHAAEEHRHAYYLKKQIAKLGDGLCDNYEDLYLIAPKASKYYLNSLDVQVCKYLKTILGLKGNDLKFAAYLMVTYAIELRADELYPVYQEALSAMESKVTVKSIILEEEGHLEEMIHQLKAFSPDWEKHANVAVNFEISLYEDWMIGMEEELAIQEVVEVKCLNY